MKVYNGAFDEYAVSKIADAVLDNYERTGKRDTLFQLESSDERAEFIKETNKLDKRFGVDQITTMIFAIHYLGNL